MGLRYSRLQKVKRTRAFNKDWQKNSYFAASILACDSFLAFKTAEITLLTVLTITCFAIIFAEKRRTLTQRGHRLSSSCGGGGVCGGASDAKGHGEGAGRFDGELGGELACELGELFGELGPELVECSSTGFGLGGMEIEASGSTVRFMLADAVEEGEREREMEMEMAAGRGSYKRMTWAMVEEDEAMFEGSVRCGFYRGNGMGDMNDDACNRLARRCISRENSALFCTHGQ